MRTPFALVLIAFQLFRSIACFNFDVWRRQNNDSSPPSPPSLNETMAQQGIPPLCYGNCTAPINQTINCILASCECTDEYEKGLYGCYLCVSNVQQLGFDAAQQKLDHVYQECTRLGYNVAQLLFPGEEILSAGSFTSTTSSSSVSTITQTFGSHPQATQDTNKDSSPDGVDPQATPDLTGVDFTGKEASNHGVKLTTGVISSFGLILMEIFAFQC